jgi:hypothetical protein
MQATQLYLELSDYYDNRGEAQSRDRFLVLAADAAYGAGDLQEAETLRQRLLTLNPHHLLKPFHSFEEAQKSRDVTDYINALKRRHPPEQLEKLVETTLGPGGHRAPSVDNPPHRHMPRPPVQPEPAPGHRPADIFKIRQPEEPAPTRVRPRPTVPPPAPPPIPANPGRMKPPVSAQHTPLSLPPLPLPPEPLRPAPASRFGPQQTALSQPAVPVYQGPGLAATSGSWFCSLLFVVWLMGGVGLAIYSLGRVFLPAQVVPARFHSARE